MRPFRHMYVALLCRSRFEMSGMKRTCTMGIRDSVSQLRPSRQSFAQGPQGRDIAKLL